jgi:V8-like Glu-specific endopeptidase
MLILAVFVTVPVAQTRSVQAQEEEYINIGVFNAGDVADAHFDWLAEALLPSRARDLTGDMPFADFIATFSGLRVPYEAVVGAALAFDAELGTPFLGGELAVQLSNLYDLYAMGVRNADQWIEDTTVDISSYGDFWVKFDSATGGSYHYVFINGSPLPIEVGFVPSTMETRAVRQGLLAPHTIVDSSDESSLLRLSTARERLTSAAVRSAPNRSVGFLQAEVSGSVRRGTAFVIASNLLGTAAHNLLHPYQGFVANSARFRLARDTTGGYLYSADVDSLSFWIHPQWVYNQRPSHDKAIVELDVHIGAEFIIPIASPSAISHIGMQVRTVGYFGGVFMYGSNGVISAIYLPYGTYGYAGYLTHTAQGGGGMSGGPVMLNIGSESWIVIGIISMGSPSRAALITSSFMQAVDTLRAYACEYECCE